MDCTGVVGQLVAYHLGTVSDEQRDSLEAHLLACRACLRTYLALKRAGDRAESERPRPAVRARLRAEVARAFPAPERRPTILGRPIPLYQGALLAALAACIALAAPSVIHRISRADVAPAAPSVDTARTRAESLHIY